MAGDRIGRKCSYAPSRQTIVSIYVLRNVLRAAIRSRASRGSADMRAYLSMCIPPTDIRERFSFDERRREGLNGRQSGAWTLL